MNVNEVLAHRGGAGLHPNDHVNRAQSTNDTFPTAAYVAVLTVAPALDQALAGIEAVFRAKGRKFSRIVKAARTHLQDAVPITLGAEFAAYARAISECRKELSRRSKLLLSVPLGGTAVGTGTNAPKGFRRKAVRNLARLAGLRLTPATDMRFHLQSHQPLAAFSGALKELALELIRISNDLRLLASGPRAGLAEIRLPAAQAGSSIMPGKVNPSLLECLTMICFQIVGRDAAVSLAAQAGQLDLNVMTPLTAYNLLDSVQLLVNFLPVLEKGCLNGLTADAARCREYLENSPSLAALLNPVIGYEKGALIFKEAAARGKSVRDLVIEKKLMPGAAFDRLVLKGSRE
jgi:aspartate ammonia-lyase